MGQPGRNGQIPETCDLPVLNQEEADSLNKPISNSEIEVVVKKKTKNSQQTKNIRLFFNLIKRHLQKPRN